MIKIQGKKVRVFDYGGESFDRYTVFLDGMVFGMSSNPLSPCGFSQYCGEVLNIPKPYTHLGKEINRIEELPDDVVTAIKHRFESIEKECP